MSIYLFFVFDTNFDTLREIKMAEVPQRSPPLHMSVPAESIMTERLRPGFSLAFCLLVTAIAYAPVFRAGFLNLDDQAYIVYNPVIRDISPAGIGRIFSTFQYM